MRQHGNANELRSRTLWLIAAVLAATWAVNVQAHDIGRSGDTSVIARGDSPAPQDAEGQEHEKAEKLARELAATKRDLDVLLRLLNRACDESARTGQAADRETAELRKALQEERDRAARKERDLAAMRCSVEPQGAPATTGDEIAPPKSAADAGSADLQKSLQQEQDRARQLEQDLAAARRDVETQTALAAKAAAEANQLKTADAGSADLQKSLQQEHDRASGLEQDLAAARRDVETQTALATKAAAEASQLKKTTAAAAADMRKSMQQEHDRASRLEQDLAASRRKVDTQTALTAKAAAETSQLKKTTDAAAADMRKSLQQEHDRASRLEQDLAASRRKVETQTALTAKAGAEASQLKKTTDAAAADMRKSLQQEHDRASRLEQDLAAARRDVETQTALAAKAAAEANQIKTADADSTDLQKSLQQEHDRASGLEQDLAAARRDVETQTALATKAAAEANQLKKTAEAGTAGLRKSLQQQRDRAAQLEHDLALARKTNRH